MTKDIFGQSMKQFNNQKFFDILWEISYLVVHSSVRYASYKYEVVTNNYTN